MSANHALLEAKYKPAEKRWQVEADAELGIEDGLDLVEALNVLSRRGWMVLSSFSPSAPTAVFVLSRSTS